MTMPLLLALAFQMSTPELDALAREINCGDPRTQGDMNVCASIDFQRADLALNAAYRTAIARAQRNDRELRPRDGDGDTRPGYEAVLRAAQRAWLTYREQHCTWQGYNEARGGTMEPMSYSACLAATTAARTEELTGQGGAAE